MHVMLQEVISLIRKAISIFVAVENMPNWLFFPFILLNTLQQVKEE